MSIQAKPGSRRWRILFPLISVLLGTALFVLLEVCLSLVDIADPDSLHDPLIGFTEIRPLFVLNQENGQYEISPSRRVYFNFDSFSAEKPLGEYRIFCLGGSTVAGRPYGIETSFTEWLKIGLDSADPERLWEVVNCGGVSYASYRLLPILKEVLAFEPDLLILYMGHNEFLEDRTFHPIKNLPRAVSIPLDWTSQLRTFTLLRKAFPSVKLSERPGRTTGALPSEVQARLDYKNGLDKYHDDPIWRAHVIEEFRHNLRRMIQLAKEADVPILLINPGCNLRDCPPFKSQGNGNLTEVDVARFQSLCRQARESYGSNPNRSVALLLEATELDNRNASAFYELGKSFDAVGRIDEAFESYRTAKELDICPLRILDSMSLEILDLAEDDSVPLVNAKSLLAEESRDGIPGNGVYIDHVHPTIGGHQLIAEALLERMWDQKIVVPMDGWREVGAKKRRKHLDSLDDLYFAKGLDRLEMLRSWAAGQSELSRP